MSLRQFLDGSGELQFEGTFVSPRIIREALEKRFRFVVIEETAHQLRGKIVRYTRLYAAPVLWPHTTIRIQIHREGLHARLSWHFHWPDYYMLLLIPLAVLTMAATPPQDASLVPFGGLFFTVFFLSLIFLDTKWVARRVRKTLQK